MRGESAPARQTSGHLACPPSRRGHSWIEMSGPTIRDLAELRVCSRCGEIGRVSAQGIVVATGDRVRPEAHL